MTKGLAKTHPELFHYTNAKGLVGIIESQSIWATDYRYLNDSTEIKFFLKDCLPSFLQPIGEEYLNELISQNSITQLLINQQGGREKIIKSYIRDTLDANEKILLGSQNPEVALAEPYITSFCTVSGLEKVVCDQVTAHGLLSQWRGYGHEGGYAIVFDTEYFSLLLKDVNEKWKNHLGYFFIGDVVYSSDPNCKFVEEFDEDLSVIKEFFSNHLKDIEDDRNLEKIFYSLMRCACRYKHWGFKEENEVRIVVLPHTKNKDYTEMVVAQGITDNTIPRKFFSKAGALVPYINLFEGVTSPNKPLPIKRIVVGPTTSIPEKNRRINAVRMLIEQHGIKAEVTASEIPYVG